MEPAEYRPDDVHQQGSAGFRAQGRNGAGRVSAG